MVRESFSGKLRRSWNLRLYASPWIVVWCSVARNVALGLTEGRPTASRWQAHVRFRLYNVMFMADPSAVVERISR